MNSKLILAASSADPDISEERHPTGGGRRPADITIFTDGGSRGNPGLAAYGFVVKVDGRLVKEGRGRLGIATNNFAEYTALIRALEFAKENFKGEDLKFYMDSNLAVSQLSGLFKIKNAAIRELVFEVRQLESEFGQITYTHIPREKNKEADRQVNLALDLD